MDDNDNNANGDGIINYCFVPRRLARPRLVPNALLSSPSIVIQLIVDGESILYTRNCIPHSGRMGDTDFNKYRCRTDASDAPPKIDKYRKRCRWASEDVILLMETQHGPQWSHRFLEEITQIIRIIIMND